MIDVLRVRLPSGIEELISIKDVLAINYREDYSSLKTRKGDRFLPITKQGLVDLALKYGFIESDREYFVNHSQIRKYHSAASAIFFDNVSSLKEAKEKGVVSAFLHQRYVKSFRDRYGIENDLAYKMEMNKSRNAKHIFSFKKLDEFQS